MTDLKAEKVDPSTGQFIDPMFAVVIAAAVTETFVAWAKSATYPSCFVASVVALGYINLLLSWFGYHKSVHGKPIRGSLRFIITVALLPLYLMTIIMGDKDFAYTALIYGLIFFLWSVWEKLKCVEHNEHSNFWHLQFRCFNLIAYFAAIYAWGASSFLKPSYPSKWFVSYADEISVILIATAIFVLRVTKSASKREGPIANILSESSTLFFGRDTSQEQ